MFTFKKIIAILFFVVSNGLFAYKLYLLETKINSLEKIIKEKYDKQ